ncbi:hypothetical protein AUC70_03870 [Methyloceanibacter stevinii]|uniref:Autotransporter domain-containing protein n=1 Tax=Methyloceanibacter stevinii TaxID=1774970 RepID=A0A1E3VN30_9HYPH|nr:hypothetical protein [Methyloceanibacter stevinii]ODR94929.1 hypothetical protein AUC70_03870 [Methyloceanibacter stevinii]
MGDSGGSGGISVFFGGALQGSSAAVFHNDSSGGQTITANGSVTGTAGAGIYAQNGSLASNITITTAVGTTVSGTVVGIGADNNGVGAISITTNGDVSGGSVQGIRATNNGSATTVKAYGDVSSTDSIGIYIYGETPSAGDITLITGDSTNGVTGGTAGIVIRGDGTTGDVIVNAQGDVTGKAGDGIFATNSNGDTLSITTGASTSVTGADDGIRASSGAGATSITANGEVRGTNDAGIEAYNDTNASDLTVTAGAKVEGGTFGVYAFNNGKGFVRVTANGDVTGTVEDGIRAESGGTDLTVTADAMVTGGKSGIAANNSGGGETEITANGAVTGTAAYGIHAENGGTATHLTVTAGATVMGGQRGILTSNKGTGATKIRATSDVTGTLRAGI